MLVVFASTFIVYQHKELKLVNCPCRASWYIQFVKMLVSLGKHELLDLYKCRKLLGVQRRSCSCCKLSGVKPLQQHQTQKLPSSL